MKSTPQTSSLSVIEPFDAEAGGEPSFALCSGGNSDADTNPLLVQTDSAFWFYSGTSFWFGFRGMS